MQERISCKHFQCYLSLNPFTKVYNACIIVAISLLSSLPSPSLILLSLSLSRNLSRHLSPTLSRISLYHRQDSFSQERREIDFKIQLYTHPPLPQTFQALPEVLPPSVIPFWKPLMIPNLDPHSDANFLQIFLQPYFANPRN